MNSKDKITSILDAINKINSSPPKKKPSITIENQNSIPKLNQSSPLPPDVDKLIREAEYYKKTVISSSEMYSHKNRSSEIKRDNVLILTEEFIDTPVTENKEIIKLKNEIKNLEFDVELRDRKKAVFYGFDYYSFIIKNKSFD